MKKENRDAWWGEFPIKAGSTAEWQIGPIRIAIQRLARELIVAHERIEPEENQPAWQFIDSDQDLDREAFGQVSRYVWQNEPEQLTILPALADRSVVSRPFTPFTVPADESATVYVSTPLWFVLTDDPPEQSLFEVAVQRPSDTWFGPSTLEGETCYASRTHARLNLENLNFAPYRAITQVHIHNNTPLPLLVERLNLPVPYLSLFHADSGALWTETVTVVQTRGTSMSEFNIEKAPPPAAIGAELLVPPRQDPQKGMLIRAFSVLKLQGFD